MRAEFYASTAATRMQRRDCHGVAQCKGPRLAAQALAHALRMPISMCIAPTTMQRSSPPARTVLLLSNRFAGLAFSRIVETTTARLRARGIIVEDRAPQSIEEARALARDAARARRFDAVIAAGGDGTIRQIAAELVGTETPLAIVPGGTGNVLANEIGLAKSTDAIVNMITNGRTISIAVARANDEPFLLMASAGLDARVLQRLDPRLKGRIGKAAYAPATLGALMRPLDELRVRIGAATHTATWAIIANARHYGGAFVLTRSTNVATPGLVAVLFKTKPRAHLLAQLLSLAQGRLEPRAARTGDVAIVPCTGAVIEADTPVPTQLDGDVFATTPLTVRQSGETIRLVVPSGCTLC